ncbi:Digeranylgeranylglyceryl phosphate synthase [uncultured archaeon]|nr:Digeranylgeranylglyceryl phosphate synthase [uncultured archaeon]
MADLKAGIDIIRPVNCFFAGISALAAMYIENASLATVLSATGLFAFVAVVLLCGAGNIFNDYFDIESDMINKPKRPLPSGRIKQKEAMALGLVLAFFGIVAAYRLNINALLLAGANLAILYTYSRMKETTPFGNIVVAYLAGSVFLFGGIAVSSVQKVWILALLSALATFAREITKDIEDIKGDKFRKTTLATYYGDKVAGIIGGSILIAAIFLSILPLRMHIFGARYLYGIFVADCIFAYCAYRLVAEPTKYASDNARLEKVGMWAALVAFIVGAMS